MGPITLFDKSFLQSLTVDESVWFDHYFLINVCPLFYVETLADLDKSVRERRTPEQEVEIIADKFPEMHGTPSAHHEDLYINNLLGHQVPMTGQIPVAGGRFVKVKGKSGTVFERPPEAEAFSRWQKGEVQEVERRYAKAWRASLGGVGWTDVARAFRLMGIDAESCKKLGDAAALAKGLVSRRDKPMERSAIALAFLRVPESFHLQIVGRYVQASFPPLVRHAPYAAHVLAVELFFQIALTSNLISSERPSNRMDMSYLFYLPFSMMFVSSDRLHQKCAPFFLRKDQEFVWGLQLKEALGQPNEHFLHLPDHFKEKGVFSFAGDPPEVENAIVTRLWDRFLQRRRERKEADGAARTPPTAEEIQQMAEAPSLSPDEADPVSKDRALLKRSVRRVKGSWCQVPKDLEGPTDR